MKFQVAFLISILAILPCADGQKAEKQINQERRFLADRAVTTSELATHGTYAAGLWTSLGGIVYDITNFVHPGGKSTILSVGGKTGDTLYMKAFNNGDHPFTIAEVVTRTGIVRIGPLQNGPVPTKAPTPTPVTTTKAPTPTPVTTTKAPALGTTSKSPTRRARPSRRPTKRPTTRVIGHPTHEDESESSSNDHSD